MHLALRRPQIDTERISLKWLKIKKIEINEKYYCSKMRCEFINRDLAAPKEKRADEVGNDLWVRN